MRVPCHLRALPHVAPRPRRLELNYRFCEACYALHEKKGYCVVCYNDCQEEEGPMVCCDKCEFWVHIECDAISEMGADFMAAKGDKMPYHCPRCTGDPPGTFGKMLEEKLPQTGKYGVKELAKVRDKREAFFAQKEAEEAAAAAGAGGELSMENGGMIPPFAQPPALPPPLPPPRPPPAAAAAANCKTGEAWPAAKAEAGRSSDGRCSTAANGRQWPCGCGGSAGRRRAEQQRRQAATWSGERSLQAIGHEWPRVDPPRACWWHECSKANNAVEFDALAGALSRGRTGRRSRRPASYHLCAKSPPRLPSPPVLAATAAGAATTAAGARRRRSRQAATATATAAAATTAGVAAAGAASAAGARADANVDAAAIRQPGAVLGPPMLSASRRACPDAAIDTCPDAVCAAGGGHRRRECGCRRRRRVPAAATWFRGATAAAASSLVPSIPCP